MARVQYGVFVTEIKGKVQGHVLQGGNVGFVLRNKGYTKGNSSRVRFVSSKNVAIVAQGWRTLTDVERAAWEAYAPTWPFVNKFGAPYTGTGYQVFMACNVARLTTEEDWFPDVPLSATASNPGIFTLATSTTASLTCAITIASVLNDQIFIYASAPVSAGRNGNNIAMRFIGNYSYDSVSTFNIRSAYIAIYGSYPVGSKIFVRAEFRNEDNTYAMFQQFANAIIT